MKLCVHLWGLAVPEVLYSSRLRPGLLRCAGGSSSTLGVYSQLRPLISLSHGAKGQSLRRQAEHEAQDDVGQAKMTCHGDLWASLEPFPPGGHFI